ncbi:MAG: DUF58 domain-containing protein [Myxococcota bacterium]|nr:DUF58 domain-containing protein [Myxococcota bacterium]
MSDLRARWSRRVQVRPTALGWAYLGAVLGLTVAAFNTGNNLLYVVLALLLSVLVLQSVLAEANLRRIRVSRQLPEDVFAFEAAHGSFLLDNPRTLLPAFSLELEEVDRGEARGAVISVHRSGRVELPVSWTFASRGEVRLGRLRMSSTFPFGLFRRYRDVELGGTVLVYPRRGKRVAAKGRPGRGGGDEESLRTGGEGDFMGLRPYVSGDPVRSIHWPNSARGLGPMVVSRSAASSEEVLVRVPGNAGRLEQELERACGEVARHLSQGRAVGLQLPDRSLPLGKGAKHRRSLLTALALQPPEGR